MSDGDVWFKSDMKPIELVAADSDRQRPILRRK